MKHQFKSRAMTALLMRIIGFVCLAGAVSIGVAFAYYARIMILNNADERLLSAVEFTHELLGQNYHDKIVGKDSISREQYIRIIDRNDDLCRRLDLQYLWSVLVLEDKIVFTSATRSDVNNPISTHALFFETHRDPDAFNSAMGAPAVPVYSSFHNEWGEGLMVLVPRLNAEGRRYIIGASVQIDELNRSIWNAVWLALISGGVLFGVIWLIASQLTRRITSVFSSITSAARQMKDGYLDVELPTSGIAEARQVCEALNNMRQELKQRIQELEIGNEILSMVAMGSELPEVLTGICRGCEKMDDKIRASVLLFDPVRQVLLPGAAPSLPDDFNDLMKPGLPIGPDVVSCGTAAFTCKLAVSADIQNDPRWTSYRAFIKKTREHDLKACWSMPIFSSTKVVLGSLTNYCNQTGEPTARNLRILEWAANISAMAIDKKQAEEKQQLLEAQLFQAQKLETVGRLAGGVAHDFNNMLGVILGHTELALLQADENHDLYSDLKEIQTAATRSADITKQLLAFARKEIISPRQLDLNDTVESMLNMLRRLIGEGIDLIWQPAAHLWSVKMDSSQIDQILANLCVNARDAIAGVGKLTIETGKKIFDEAYCKEHPGCIPGDFVLLAVSDNGCGMDKDTLDNLFEPFFTTKEVGKGTGLGLATVYGIVKQNNGFINVYSEPGQGSTFKIYLPRLVADEDSDKAIPEKQTAAGGKETILLVEDEPTILRMTRMMLERKGYSVLSAGSPAEAVEKAKKHSGAIDLLMTDVVMPEMNGRDLAGKITSLYPDIRLLFMSGYTSNVIAHHGTLDDGVAFIQKPFSMAEMTEKVREVLDMAPDKNQG